MKKYLNPWLLFFGVAYKPYQNICEIDQIQVQSEKSQAFAASVPTKTAVKAGGLIYPL